MELAVAMTIDTMTKITKSIKAKIDYLLADLLLLRGSNEPIQEKIKQEENPNSDRI